jgi:hypothetical protein
MLRKVKGNKRIGKVERDLVLSIGAIRNRDGRDTRSDKKLETMRKYQNN